MEKVAEFACLSGSAEWLEDGMRLVFTRIDDVREEATRDILAWLAARS